jgi:hypothetical protein
MLFLELTVTLHSHMYMNLLLCYYKSHCYSLVEWRVLAESFTLPAAPLAVLRRVPIIGALAEPYIYRRLAFIFELASNFISAHEDVDILQLIQEGPVAYQLAFEKVRLTYSYTILSVS